MTDPSGAGIDALLEALRKSGVDVDSLGSDEGSSKSGAASSESTRSDADARATEDTASSQAKSQEKKTREKRSSNRTSSRSGGSRASGRRSDRRSSSRGDSAWGGFGGFGGSGGSGSSSSFMEAISRWGKKALIIALIVLVVILLVAYWWFHPPISINSPDCWVFVSVFILLPLFIFFRSRSRRYETGDSKVDPSPTKHKAFKRVSYVPVIIVLVGIIGAIGSLALIPGNDYKYATVLQTDTLDFAEDIQEVDYSQIPVIDRDSAILLGNREMGTIPDYVSQFEVSDLYSQINYQGAPVRVSPLGYADFIKWITNRAGGIPAYALVNMTTQDAEIVRLGENAIFYSQSEPFMRNIDRYVQLKYPFYIFDQKSFEIDEDGHPWWICPVRTYTIGLFGGQTISRVVLCDATTGECTDLAVEEVPQWVDRVFPADLLIEQYNWSGRYQNGWWNSWLGQAGVVQTTPGTNGELGYNYIAKDDDVWVYTGVTSATADSSIVGFVLVNQRTAESHFYSVAGATETSAMESAEGQVQNLRYDATFPLLINVANQPTYFMALKDGAGLVKMFAMLDIRRYQNVAVGDTVASCQKSYETLLATNGVLADDPAAVSALMSTTTGTIRSIAQATIDGNSHFYITLEGQSGIYDFALPAFLEVVGYQVGDTITFSYVAGDPASPVQGLGDEVPGARLQDSASSGSESGSSDAAGASSASAEASG